MTGSMERALAEMDRRRATQMAYNAEHGITPVSIRKSVDQVRFVTRVADARTERPPVAERLKPAEPADREALIAALERQMREAAAELDFELAAQLRDQLFDLKSAADPVRRSPVGSGAAPMRGGYRRRRSG
jgi:excinuclease ABC subunit B